MSTTDTALQSQNPASTTHWNNVGLMLGQQLLLFVFARRCIITSYLDLLPKPFIENQPPTTDRFGYVW